MRKTERASNATLRKHLTGNPFIRFRLHRIENIAGEGTPDLNYCTSGREGWIETKSPVEPKRPDTPLFGSNHKMSQEQMNWHLEQWQNGGRSFIYIDSDKRRLLIPGWLGDRINTATIAELEAMALWKAMKPTKEDQWNALRLRLSGVGHD